jgi:pimeloyl-ACP methyl ester carboxylesterase
MPLPRLSARSAPRLSHRILGRAASTFDRAVVVAMEMKNRGVRARAESLSHDERMERLAIIQRAYGAPELLSNPDAYFAPPRAIAPNLVRVRGLAAKDGSSIGSVYDASWDSAYELFGADIRAAYDAHERNRTAHARLYLAREPRPVVILVHGYMAGQWAVEERAWPIEWLIRRGLDVAIAVLPFHALRGRVEGGAPDFPGADPRVTNEGFRQAIADIRALAAFLRARGPRGAVPVGVMGMSLGGYTASLLATVERDLAFAVPLIPLASIADFARDQGRLGDGEASRLQHRALEEANWVVSPLARPSLVDKERMLVIGASADRITPIAHAECLAAHFDAPLHTFHGGHLLQFGRAEAFREVRRMLERLEIMRS